MNVQGVIDVKDTRLPIPLPKRRKVNTMENRELNINVIKIAASQP